MMTTDEETPLYLPGEERFGAISSHFYRIVNVVPTLRRFYDFVVEYVLDQEFRTALDIGSGPGITLLRIAETRDGTYLGVDPSPQMVRIANRKSRKLGIANKVSFRIGSSRSIPGEERFDLIYTSLSFHHWKDREKSIDGIMQRLNSEGSFIIFEVTDDGSFNRKFVKSHLMNREDFLIIGKRIGMEPELYEKNGYISCRFRKPGN